MTIRTILNLLESINEALGDYIEIELIKHRAMFRFYLKGTNKAVAYMQHWQPGLQTEIVSINFKLKHIHINDMVMFWISFHVILYMDPNFDNLSYGHLIQFTKYRLFYLYNDIAVMSCQATISVQYIQGHQACHITSFYTW